LPHNLTGLFLLQLDFTPDERWSDRTTTRVHNYYIVLTRRVSFHI